MRIPRVFMGIMLLGAASLLCAQQDGGTSEVSVEDAYLQSFESMIVRELVGSEGRDNKTVALQYIEAAIERGNVSDDMAAACSALALEGLTNVSRNEGRVSNNYPDIRARACACLGKINTEEAKNTLIQVLYTDNEPMVVTSAVRSLGEMGMNENDETTEMIAWIARKFNIVNPTSSLAMEILDAFEKLAPSTQNTTNMIQVIISIAGNYQYVTPVRTRAYEVLKSMSSMSSSDKKSSSNANAR